MIAVFADTSYWIAVLNRRDPLHPRALSVNAKLSATKLVTSEMVLAELLNGMSGEEPLRVASSSAVERMRRRGTVAVVPQTPEQFDAAFLLYKRAADKLWSLTDCASFLLMRQMGIREALTYDQHFVQAGFTALLRS